MHESEKFEFNADLILVDITGSGYSAELEKEVRLALLEEAGVPMRVTGSRSIAAGAEVSYAIDFFIGVIVSGVTYDLLKCAFSVLARAFKKCGLEDVPRSKVGIITQECEFFISANCNAGFYDDEISYDDLLCAMADFSEREKEAGRPVKRIETPCDYCEHEGRWEVICQGVGNFSLWKVGYKDGPQWPEVLYDAANGCFVDLEPRVMTDDLFFSNDERTGDDRSFDGPLPGHTKIDYSECSAKHVLGFIDSSLYGGLKLSDKPDLIDPAASLGVEVTDAIPRKAQEATSLYAKLSEDAGDDTRRTRWIERIEQCGLTYDNGILLDLNGKDSFELVHVAHRKKLEKLNGGDYRSFDRYELFVRSEICADDAMLRSALTQMIEDACKFDRKYSVVTVNVPGYNYRFDLENDSYAALEFNPGDQRRIGAAARREVVDEERKC